ncbi:MAG: HAD family hydrolase [Coxiellaceae bacterium]|nr:HAD family hydrolase [Coxiellaceae bacterium]
MQLRSIPTRSMRFFSLGQSALHRQLNGIFHGTELVIMDIDGTVLNNTIPFYWKHMNITRATYTNKPHWSANECLQYFEKIHKEHGASWISRQHVMAAMIEVAQHDQLIEVAIQTFYQSFANDPHAPSLFPHLKELMIRLREQQIPVMAFSDTDHFLIDTLLAKNNIREYFHNIVGETRKPDPAILHAVLAQHPELPQTTGDHVVVIGDNLATDGALAKAIDAKFIYFVGGVKTVQRQQAIDNVAVQQQNGCVPNDTIVIDNFNELCVALCFASLDSCSNKFT